MKFLPQKKWLLAIVVCFLFSCNKDDFKVNECTTSSLEIVEVSDYYARIYINGVQLKGSPIPHWQEITVDTLRIGVTYNIAAVNTYTHDSLNYSVTLKEGSCNSITTQDVNP